MPPAPGPNNVFQRALKQSKVCTPANGTVQKLAWLLAASVKCRAPSARPAGGVVQLAMVPGGRPALKSVHKRPGPWLKTQVNGDVHMASLFVPVTPTMVRV